MKNEIKMLKSIDLDTLEPTEQKLIKTLIKEAETYEHLFNIYIENDKEMPEYIYERYYTIKGILKSMNEEDE